jgi:hypothetical protein
MQLAPVNYNGARLIGPELLIRGYPLALDRYRPPERFRFVPSHFDVQMNIEWTFHSRTGLSSSGLAN